MELDEYKTIIRQRPQVLLFQKSVLQVEIILQKKTHSVAGKIKSSLKLEAAFALLFVLFTCFVVVSFKSIFIQLFALLLLGFCLGFVYYLDTIYKKVTFYDSSVLSVKESLQKLIRILSLFTGFYFQLSMIFLPVTFFLGLVTSYLDMGSASPEFMVWFSSRQMITYIFLFIIWSAVIYFFTKWYVKKLYGNYLNNLQEQLDELQNS